MSSHYDTLKVSRDAPIEVIQAAYRSLARKYHPDRTGNTEGQRMMQAINAAYAVLSDPAEREKYDRGLASQESGYRQAGGGTRAAGGDESGGGTSGSGNSLNFIVAAIGYGLTALALLRMPGSRWIGIAMLVAGWIILQRRRR